MKKLALYGLAMLLALAGFNSCEKEKEDTDSNFSVTVDKVPEFPRSDQKRIYNDFDSMEILLHDRVDSLLIVLNPDYAFVEKGRYPIGTTDRYSAKFTLKGPTTAENKVYLAESGSITLTEVGKRLSGKFDLVMRATDGSDDIIALSNGLINNVLISKFPEEDE